MVKIIKSVANHTRLEYQSEADIQLFQSYHCFKKEATTHMLMIIHPNYSKKTKNIYIVQVRKFKPN